MKSANALLLVVLFGLILVGSLLLFLPGSGAPRGESVLSTQEDGRRALLLLLDELGYDARAFTESPAELPRGGAALVLAAVPPEPVLRPSEEEPASGPRGRRDPRHYRRFVDEGGVLLAPASEAMLAFLVEDLGFDAAREIDWIPGRELAAVELASGEACAFAGTPERLASLDPGPSGARLLALSPQGTGFAVALPCGAGTLVLSAPGPDPWANERIARGEHALLFVRLLELVGSPRTVLFDEYALGGWTPDSPVELAFAPEGFVLSAHLVLFSFLLLWRLVWVRAFPRDPEALAHVSALSRARALARLLERSGRSEERTS